MAGLYFHIPFCRRACNYCDFHFSTRLQDKAKMLESMQKELGQRRDYLQDKALDSIYFGGGTPSLLEEEELKGLISAAKRYFVLKADAEITLEVNPDDVQVQMLRAWKRAGIKRLSLGLQSLNPEELRWMNRLHDPQQGIEAIAMARAEGFENFSVDLIYGSKWQNEETWTKTLDTVLGFDPPHISAYNLTIEQGTELGLKNRRKQEPSVDESLSAGLFKILRTKLRDAGYLHYEISNFAKPGYEARHNSSYWKGLPYLGIGPSAHSFNGTSRQWNLSNNPQYCKALESGSTHYQSETLSLRDRYNEYVLTGLRTTHGCDLSFIKENFGKENAAYFSERLKGHQQHLSKEGERVCLNEEGMLMADAIASDLFLSA